MKITNSIKKICKNCRIIYRKKKLYRLCIIHKHKAHQ